MQQGKVPLLHSIYFYNAHKQQQHILEIEAQRVYI